jgi:hypothetical protein
MDEWVSIGGHEWITRELYERLVEAAKRTDDPATWIDLSYLMPEEMVKVLSR